MKTEHRLAQWIKITSAYHANEKLQQDIFNELIGRYSEPGRYYHNLMHIENMLKDLEAVYGKEIPATLFFATWFHDAIYNPLRGNNEQKSAALAEKRLTQLSIPAKEINEIKNLILKTGNHLEANTDNEACRFFLDIDMKILGADKSIYNSYTNAVRKEYNMYPDLMFNHGRKKFIEKTLAAERIFKTQHFFNAFEKQARKNLITELNQLL